jgi:phenylacetate-CoA ligase
MYSSILKNIVYPFYERKLSPEERVMPYLKLLNKTQWWTVSDLEKFQLKKLKMLLNHADKNVPYYHKLFKRLNFKPDDITNVNELERLPILTKEIIRDNFEDLSARNYSKDDLIFSATSGSTGTPMKFFIDQKWKSYNWAAALRAWSWSGYELGEKMVYLWGALQDLKDQDNFINKIRNYTLRIEKLNAFDLTPEKMQNYVNILRKYKPKTINTYSSAAFFLAQYIEKRKIEDIHPEAILTTADMLFDYRRKTIERVFGCKVFDYYSGRDTSLQASECPEHFGYHLSIENAVVEFIKENEPVAFGETGKIILTDLCNYAMPFIRYEIGDLGIPSDEPCSCGRTLPIMKSFKGRILDMIVTPEGKILHGGIFPGIFAHYDFKSFGEYQIIQKRKDKLLIKLVKRKEYNDSELDIFINIIKRNVGEQMEIDVEFVDKINLTASGKHRHVLSEIPESDIEI